MSGTSAHDGRPGTVGEAVASASLRLAGAGLERPRHEAWLLTAGALGLSADAARARPQRPVAGEIADAIERLVQRRLAREPIAYILGEREFWSLPFRVTRDTLVPRPDSETVVEAALAWASAGRGELSILDLGTGTGCLLLALLSELPGASGVGVDASLGAIRVARANAEALGLAARARFLVGDWGGGLGGGFDVAIANPPYVPERELAGLAPEVAAFEPRWALAGGADGLDAVRAIAPDLARLLRPGGAAFVEVGAGQAPRAANLLEAAGLRVFDVRRDLADVPRCIGASSPGRAAAAKKKCWKGIVSRLA